MTRQCTPTLKFTRTQGFTLIEILVVIVIIGSTIGFALLAFGDFGESKRILFAAEQVENTLRLAQQQAILESTTLGLYINNNNYQIVQFKESKQWGSNNKSALFKVHSFPKAMFIQLKKTSTNTAHAPDIIIDASGEISPFTLSFSSSSEKNIALISCNERGDLTFTAHTS